MDNASPPLLTPQEFVIVAVANQCQYGREKGGTKALEYQDEAWHALLSLLLGVAFDANGIVIHIPPTATTAAETDTASNVSPSLTNQKYDEKNTALEELATNLAERLATHGCAKDDDDNNNSNEEQEEKNGKDDKGDVATIGGTN
eukprot:4137200-Ditylum_brightwellii.AAC.1